MFGNRHSQKQWTLILIAIFFILALCVLPGHLVEISDSTSLSINSAIFASTTTESDTTASTTTKAPSTTSITTKAPSTASITTKAPSTESETTASTTTKAQTNSTKSNNQNTLTNYWGIFECDKSNRSCEYIEILVILLLSAAGLILVE